MVTASLRTHTDAVIARLVAGGLVVGDASPPTVPYGGETRDTFIKYAIVYPLGGPTDGDLVDPNSDATLSWQVTCVGFTREMAEWVVDRCNTLLDGHMLTVTGRSVEPIYLDLSGAAVRRDDDVKPPVFYGTPRYRATSRPA